MMLGIAHLNSVRRSIERKHDFESIRVDKDATELNVTVQSRDIATEIDSYIQSNYEALQVTVNPNKNTFSIVISPR